MIPEISPPNATSVLPAALRASEESFRLLVSSVRDYAIIMLDPQGRIMTWNEGAQRLKGYSEAEALGMPMESLYPPEAVAAGTPPRLLARAIAEGRAEDEGWRIRKDGSRFCADVVITPMRNAAGELLGFAKITRDITARKRTEEALRLSEEHLNRAEQLAQMGSDIRDPRTGERTWSNECYRIYGVLPGTFVPTPDSVLAMVHPDDRARILGLRAQVAAGICPNPVDYRIVRPDGSVREVHREWTLAGDHSEDTLRVLSTIHDVTEHRRTEEQARQAQKMAAVAKLTGGMAHDFNNLLGVIMVNIDLVREQPGLDPGLRELLDDAVSAAERGAELTNRLLAFAQRQPLRAVPVDINASVAGVVEQLRGGLGDTIEVETELAEDVWQVSVDPAQLNACLSNIIANARDAMPTGGRLTFRTANREIDAAYAAAHPDVLPGDFAMIEIADTGVGMPPEVRRQMFEPFFTTKARGGGTGLGLSMVFGFVQQSDGYVSVDSEPGHGTVFRLYLPRATTMPVAVDVSSVEASPRSSGEATVLVVDDNPALRRGVARQLRELGHHVVECDSAAASLDILQHEHIDLLLTDIVMPGRLDGVELARLARGHWPELKIVLTSGYPQGRIDEFGELLRGFHFLRKPFRREDLTAVISAALAE